MPNEIIQTEPIAFKESAFDGGEGKLWAVTVIKAGDSTNGRKYSRQLLRENAHKFENAPIYESLGTDHSRQYRGFGSEKGVIRNPRYDDAAGAIVAEALIGDPIVREKLRTYHEGGALHERVGLSVVFDGLMVTRGTGKGEVRSMDVIKSVDLVHSPAAGGRLDRIMEAEMTDEILTMLKTLQEGQESMAAESKTLSEAVSAMQTRIEEMDKEKSAADKKEMDEMGTHGKGGKDMKEADDEGNDKDEMKESAETPPAPVAPAVPEYMVNGFDENTLRVQLSEAKLPEAAENKIRENFAVGSGIDPEELREAIKGYQDVLQAVTAQEDVEKTGNADGAAPGMPQGRVLSSREQNAFGRTGLEWTRYLEAQMDAALRPAGVVRITNGEGKTYPVYMPTSLGRLAYDWTGEVDALTDPSVRKRIYTGRLDESQIAPPYDTMVKYLDQSEVSEAEFCEATSVTPAVGGGTAMGFSQTFEDRKYKALVNYVNNYNDFQLMNRVAKTLPSSDFHALRRIKIGYLSKAAPIAPYTQYPYFAMPEDEETTIAPVKTGGIVRGLSWEAYVQDDITAMRRFPERAIKTELDYITIRFFDEMLSAGAAATTGTGLAIYGPDSENIFTGTKNNRIAGNLTIQNLHMLDVMMYRQLMYNDPTSRSDDFLGFTPRSDNPPEQYGGTDTQMKILVVPKRNEGLAKRIVLPSQFQRLTNEMGTGADANVNIDTDYFSHVQEVYVSDRLPQPATLAAGNVEALAFADPMGNVEGAVITYMGGRTMPDVIVQNDPTVGENFTHDAEAIKVRWPLECGITDYRPLGVIVRA